MSDFLSFLVSVGSASLRSRLGFYYLIIIFLTAISDVLIILSLPSILSSILQNNVVTINSLLSILILVIVNTFLKIHNLYLLKRLSVRIASKRYADLLTKYKKIDIQYVSDYRSSRIRNSLFSLPVEILRYTFVPFLTFISVFFLGLFITLSVFIVAPLEFLIIFSTVTSVYLIYYFFNRKSISSISSNLSRSFERLEKMSNLYANTFKSKVIYRYFSSDTKNISLASQTTFSNILQGILLARFPRVLVEATSLLALVTISFILLSGNSLSNISPIVNIATIVYAAQRLLPLAQQSFNTFMTLRSYSKFFLEYQDLNSDLLKNCSSGNKNDSINTSITSVVLNCNNIIDKFIPSSLNIPINFSISSHGLLLLSGVSGSGKSTLLDIICGFKVPNNGSALIKINGIPISSNYCIAYSEQEPFLIPGSLRDNIKLGSSSSQINEKLINFYLANHLRDVISSDTLLDLERFYDPEKSNLSGGQKRRVCLARALLTDRPIIILDEPSVGLDANLEKFYFDLIARVSKTKIVILVTHSDYCSQFSADYVVNLSA